MKENETKPIIGLILLLIIPIPIFLFGLWILPNTYRIDQKMIVVGLFLIPSIYIAIRIIKTMISYQKNNHDKT